MDMRIKHVDNLEALQTLAKVYKKRGLEIAWVGKDRRIEAYNNQGQLKYIASVA